MLAGDIELLRYLISKGVDVNLQSDSGTPLIWAAGHAQPDAVKILLEHKADVSLWFFFILVIHVFGTNQNAATFFSSL